MERNRFNISLLGVLQLSELEELLSISLYLNIVTNKGILFYYFLLTFKIHYY